MQPPETAHGSGFARGSGSHPTDAEPRILTCRTGMFTVVRWALFLLLAGYLLFAHGCHADQDTELFTRFRIWL